MIDYDFVFSYKNPETCIYRIPSQKVVVLDIGGKQLRYTPESAHKIAVEILAEVAKLENS